MWYKGFRSTPACSFSCQNPSGLKPVLGGCSLCLLKESRAPQPPLHGPEVAEQLKPSSPLPLTPLIKANMARAVSTAVTAMQHSRGFCRNTRHFRTTRALQQTNLFLCQACSRGWAGGERGLYPPGASTTGRWGHVKMSVLVVPGCTRHKEAQELYWAAGYHMHKTKSTLPVIIFNPLTCLPNPFAHLWMDC